MKKIGFKKFLYFSLPFALLAIAVGIARCGSSSTSSGKLAETKPSSASIVLPDFTCPPRGTLGPAKLPTSIQHVFLLVLENTDVAEALKQPYLSTILQQGANLSNFHASTHPSYPNYLSMIAGSTFGITTDDTTSLPNSSIVDLVESAGKTWKAYAESYPGGCTNLDTSLFAARHVPFLSFSKITSNSNRCANIVDADSLKTDIQNGTLPNYAMYIPNVNNDGHDTNPAFADHWLKTTFEPLLNDQRFIANTLFVITFDEAETLASNQVYTVLYGPQVVAGSSSSICYTHQDLLRTFEDLLGLGSLGTGDATGVDIREIWLP